jgi:hypothetical protein
MMDHGDKSFPWIAIFVALQVFLLIAFFNPWIDVLRWVAGILLVVEAVGIVFWAMPIFFYQLLVKRHSWRDSLRVATKSIVDFLTFA